MNLREHLIVLIETYAKAKGNSPSHVGALLFSSGVKYRQLCEGKDITVGRLESAVRWLSDNLSLIHISEPTRPCGTSRMPSSA